MSTLLDPLEEDQATLINIIWSAFMTERADWPRYNYIEYRMRERGLDARSVIGGMPNIGKLQYHGGYAPVGYLSSGGIPTADSLVYLTMAGLFHLRHDGAMQIIGAILAYLRQMTRARDVIGKTPYDVPDTTVQLSQALKAEDEDSQVMPWASAIAEHEWPSMRCHRTVNPFDATGTLTFLHDANFHVIEDYLLAITAATTPQRATSVLDYHDPRALLRAIDYFDVTCELVLGQKLVARPPMGRSVLLAQDAQSYADLQSGMSALGEIMSEFQVPGKNPSHAIGRLLPWMKSKLPNLSQAACSRVQYSIDILDAVREIRNSGQHPKPNKKLIDAHGLLGLPFPIQDPASAWDLIRAQLDLAFEALQQEILAAR